MKSEEDKNPIISCEDIPEPFLEAWKEAPTLASGEPAEDSNWLVFKNDINKTVQNFAEFIKGNEASIPDDDYLTFQRELNESFEDLRNELQSLRPQMEFANAEPLDPDLVDSHLSDSDSINPDLLNPDSLNSEFVDTHLDPLDEPSMNHVSPNDPNLMKLLIFMNKSFEDAANQVSVVEKKHPVHHDWGTFKTNIMRVLNNSVDQLKEGSSSREDWLAFKDKIKIEVRRIKDDVADMKNQIADMKKNPKLQKMIDEDSDWNNLKTDVVESVSEVVDVIEDNLPPSGDPNRKTFVQHVKNKFHHFGNQVTTDDATDDENEDSTEESMDDLNEDSMEDSMEDSTGDSNEDSNKDSPKDLWENTSEMPIEDSSRKHFSRWENSKRRIVKSLNKAIHNIDSNKADWSDYRDEIKNKFSRKKKNTRKYSIESREWRKFKIDLNKIMDRIIEDIKVNAPSPGDPSWSEYKMKIIDMLSKFRNDIPVKPQVLLRISNETVFDWKSFRSDLNKSLCELIDDAKSHKIPSNDPKWEAFRKKFHKHMNDSKYRIPVLKLESSKSEWINFRKDLREAIKNVVIYIKENAPPCGSPDWAEFGNEIRMKFADLRKAFDLRKDEILGKIPKLTMNHHFKDVDGTSDSKNDEKINDWDSLKGDLNKTVNSLMRRRKSRKSWMHDTRWTKFRNYFNRSIFEFKCNVSKLSPKPYEKQLLKLSNDWSNFSDRINNSLTVENLENKLLKNLDWMNLRELIKNNVVKLKEEIEKIKQEWKMEENKIQNISDLEKTTNTTFNDLKNRVKNLEIEPIWFNITDKDWQEFKDSINKTVIDYVNSINQNKTNEWMNFKDMVKTSMDDLKNQIASLKNNIENSVKKIEETDNSLEISNNESMKTNNQTIDTILDSLKNSSMSESNLKNVREALVKARDQILLLSFDQSAENITKWKKYENSVMDNFKDLNEAIKNKTDIINNIKSSASKLIFNIWTSILILTLVRLEIIL